MNGTMTTNRILRRTTCAALAAVMLLGGVTIGVPGIAPASAATENLFVSVDTAGFKAFAGPMVLEIVVNDRELDDLDDAEPDVTIDGRNLAMTQATDGNWYAYVAQSDILNIADDTFADFGADKEIGDSDVNLEGFSDADDIYTGADDVVRTPKVPTTNPANPEIANEPSDATGNDATWPFIQAYNFAVDSSVRVLYNQAGNPQTISITYLDDADADCSKKNPDNPCYVERSLDRDAYPMGADIHLTIKDMMLNIDPTDEDSWTFLAAETEADSRTYYYVFDDNGNVEDSALTADDEVDLGALKFGANDRKITIDRNTASDEPGDDVIGFRNNNDQLFTGGSIYGTNAGGVPATGSAAYVTLAETGPNSAVFKSTDEGDSSNIFVAGSAPRDNTGTIRYNEQSFSVRADTFGGTVAIDTASIGGTWEGGEEVSVLLTDGDLNLNSLVDEDLTLSYPYIPAIEIGSPVTVADAVIPPPASGSGIIAWNQISGPDVYATGSGGQYTVDPYAKKLTVYPIVSPIAGTDSDIILVFDIPDGFVTDGVDYVANYDFAGFGGDLSSVTLAGADASPAITAGSGMSVLTNIGDTVTVTLDIPGANGQAGIVFDIFRFGSDGDAAVDRYADAIYRLLLEETGDNTATYDGTVEYVLYNQLNADYEGIRDRIRDKTIDDEIVVIVPTDLTDEDSVRINYLDTDGDNIRTQISDQVEAKTNTGVVSFDSANYKIADTVQVTLTDRDLNTDVETVQVYTVHADTDAVGDGTEGGLVLDITLDDERWVRGTTSACTEGGLRGTGFVLTETTATSGIFTGTFQIPNSYCNPNSEGGFDRDSPTGKDLEVNYQDYNTDSGEPTEVGDSAGIRANTGSISLDRTVYPLPIPPGQYVTFGDVASVNNGDSAVEQCGTDYCLVSKDVSLHIRINDPDYDVSASGEDIIPDRVLTTTLVRGSESLVFQPVGEIKEIKADAGIFEHDLTIPYGLNFDDAFGDRARLYDYPATTGIGLQAPTAAVLGSAAFNATLDSDLYAGESNFNREQLRTAYILEVTNASRSDIDDVYQAAYEGADSIDLRFGLLNASDNLGDIDDAFKGAISSFVQDGSENAGLQQGDIITVTYTDPTDASGEVNTVTDSSTFDLRNAVLQADKSAYIIGGDMILTLIEPDFNLDTDETESYPLNLIEWDSDAATLGMGDSGSFDPEPSELRETGDDTGIFQIVIEIPEELEEGGDGKSEKLERGEEIELEYVDYGPAGASFVGDEDEDVNLTIYTSNFGATIALDKKVYTWTDKVFITVTAPDHNFDSDLIDEIGDGDDDDPLQVSTRGEKLDDYRLVETGTDTGIFSGEVILTGFGPHSLGDNGMYDSARTEGAGPTSGYLKADDDDGLTVSYEFSEDETVVGSALIRWNIASIEWLEASYPASASGIVRVSDPDMNLDPESVDNFEVDVWSDSDAGGIRLTVTETNEATGIFEGAVSFTVTDESSGHRLRVAEGDTVTVEYDDYTLPEPYNTSDDESISATSLIGTVVAPLERAVIQNPRVTDNIGNELTSVSVDQQVQIIADIASGQDKDQQYAYLVQIQDASGVTVSLSWITATLPAGASNAPSQSWIPTQAGSYTATAFAWESIDNPTALSPSESVTISVS